MMGALMKSLAMTEEPLPGKTRKRFQRGREKGKLEARNSKSETSSKIPKKQGSFGIWDLNLEFVSDFSAKKIRISDFILGVSLMDE
jgi:hypothetical protein